MTRKVFWEDPYLTRLETRIASVRDSDVTVEETILYALSGGQESDHGTIGTSRVLEARKDGGDIIYTLDEDHGLAPGDRVTMVIDWERRYRLMRLHFAAEIVLELVYKALGPIRKIGAHIAQDKARIDFEWGENIAGALPGFQQQAALLVAADHEIVSAYSDAENQRRYWEIRAFSRVPCGGTHLRRTGEIGAIELKRKNIGKGKERIRSLCPVTRAPRRGASRGRARFRCNPISLRMTCAGRRDRASSRTIEGHGDCHGLDRKNTGRTRPDRHRYCRGRQRGSAGLPGRFGGLRRRRALLVSRIPRPSQRPG